MTKQFTFERLATDRSTQARAGRITTAHGVIETPVFMPVGTQGSVKALTQAMLEEAGAQIILGNTYHLYLRPGHLAVNQLGGLHRFIAWGRAILTDSGGFQVFSLADLRRMNEDGVEFQSHIDGSRHFLSPERSMEIQAALGSDIVMCFDECTPYPATPAEARASLEITTAWARRSKQRLDQLHADPQEAARAGLRVVNPSQALFGINQGSVYLDLRERSLEGLLEIGFDGYAIGGLSVGEEKSAMMEVVAHVAPRLPADKPRYLMGVGTPEDIVNAV
ncbi:MAG TPA: tRNA guanosine(34) transglycosylase Tgt, partial [Blastocatellia bacterium]|nr:tRNA guanosine(34) transglycosylase Tgt [Blastocatellia bacterium]